MDYREVENILSTYTLDEILELNDCTEVDILYFLLEKEFLQMPNPKPVDIYD